MAAFALYYAPVRSSWLIRALLRVKLGYVLSQRDSLEVKTYDVSEAADFLKVDRSTALELANSGLLPGAKVGRAWVFMEEELVNYLRDVTRKQTTERRARVDASEMLRIPRRLHVSATARRRPPPTLPELPSEVAST